jgi:probable rRNA maturation factor
MSKHIDVVYGNFNNIEISNTLTLLEQKALLEKRIGKITFYFVSDEELLEINRAHLNHDYYTDIITFDYSTQRKLEGEIYVSIERVKENGKDFSEELTRVMSHGVLHMLGYNDKSEEELMTMRSKEEEWIKYIVSRES